MVTLGCTATGELDSTRFSNPLPWIGVYIAVASSACAAAMSYDAVNSIRRRKLWFPTSLFSLNAATLTLISVSVKFSVDLNTPMPRHHDQLSKLSSSALLCTVIANSLPSLGTMHDNEIFSNILALTILVLTSIVNICIQLATGVIYVFWKEHAFLMLIMLILLIILCSTALTVPATKSYFEMKYNKKYKLAVKECDAAVKAPNVSAVDKLRCDLGKYWMMAHTCGPQFVIGRSATCTASGAFCLLSAMALGEATLRSHFMPWEFSFCKGDSYYKWSTTLVLVSQIVAVVVGTVGPGFRFFTAVNFRCPKKAKIACKPRFQVESYWIQVLMEWKECPFHFHYGGRQGKKLAHDLKILFLESCIRVQKGVVVVSKFVRLVSVFVMSMFLICYLYCKKCWWLIKFDNTDTNDESVSESLGSEISNMSRFVLHLEGEEVLVDLMVEDNRDATRHWFSRGKRKEPRFLLEFLKKGPSFEKIKGVYEFDSENVPSLHPEEPPNCWALPIVTLTSIAISLPGINKGLIKQLIKSVNEGLAYVRVVENNFDVDGHFENMRKTADILWLKVELYHRWLDIDLRKVSRQYDSPEKILEELANIAKTKYLENKEKDIRVCLVESPSKWPIKVLASNTMYRISRTILSDYESRDYEGGERLFERLSIMIADIFRACFTNLLRAIPLECHRSPVEEREESVRRTIVLLGKAEKILDNLDKQMIPNLDNEKLTCIDGWRSLRRGKIGSHELSSSVSDRATLSPLEVHLCIE